MATKTLCWKTGSRRWTNGLQSKFSKKNGSSAVFTTIRNGPDWANKVNPGDIVTICVIRGSKQKILGRVEVQVAKKSTIAGLADEDLAKNIGAKNRRAVHRDMQKVYKESMDANKKIVSVLELLVIG